MLTLKKQWNVTIFRTIILSASILIAACATMPAAKDANNQQMSWERRTSDLLAMTSWQANGAIGVKQQNNANSASLYWTQNGKNHYSINMQGPLGAGAMKITAKPGKVTLLQGNKPPQSAPTAEMLLKATTGWYLPVGNLYYWARGLPVPDMPAKTQYDKYNHLTQLTQQGWQVTFERYTAVGNLDLPSKMVLVKSPFTIKLVFNQWRI